MPANWGKEIIDTAQYGVLSVATDEGLPYALPLSIVRDGDKLYFHSAREGQKVDNYINGMPAQVVFVGEVKVPELYTKQELEEMRTDESRALELTRRVFTTEYESAIAHGKLYEVIDEEEKKRALRLICEKFTPNKMSLFASAYKAGGSKTRIYRIEITDITAKRKKYDAKGIEMKFGRMEGSVLF